MTDDNGLRGYKPAGTVNREAIHASKMKITFVKQVNINTLEMRQTRGNRDARFEFFCHQMRLYNIGWMDGQLVRLVLTVVSGRTPSWQHPTKAGMRSIHILLDRPAN